ncbi:MAG: hypothetical protein IRY98_04670, partial [Alicyclobacillaceae bacterium]|nr:hypothetical protein [Alicyclobacillaceae bacterium]
ALVVFHGLVPKVYHMVVDLFDPLLYPFEPLFHPLKTGFVLAKATVNLLETSVDLLKAFVDLLETSVDLFKPSVDLLKAFVDLFEAIANFCPKVDQHIAEFQYGLNNLILFSVFTIHDPLSLHWWLDSIVREGGEEEKPPVPRESVEMGGEDKRDGLFHIDLSSFVELAWTGDGWKPLSKGDGHGFDF